MTPAWLLDIVAALMLAVAAVSAARLLAARPWQRGAVVIDTDVAHLLMALAMAGMLAASLAILPAAAWEAVFGLLTVWFAVRVLVDARANGFRALAGGHCAPHLVHSAAMLYMFLALTAPGKGRGAMSGMGGMAAGSASMMSLRAPTLAFLFALILVGYSIWDLDQLSGRRYALGAARMSLAGAGTASVQLTGAAGTAGGQGAGGFLLAPAVTVGARITMGTAMVFMLIIAI
jgi:opacity protein-like surface antigen